MSRSCPIAGLRVYALSIPLRKPFEHAAQVRSVADPVVVEVELAGGMYGYGETLPRPYVSGETVATVTKAIEDIFGPELLSFRPENFPEALERIDALPSTDDEGRPILAARAAIELALLDAYSRHFNRPIEEAVSWLGLPGLGAPGSTARLRYSGVLSGRTAKLAWRARLMRWYGLRDFKLKVGYDDDIERVRATARALKMGTGSFSRTKNGTGSFSAPSSPQHPEGRPGKTIPPPFPTLRLDANGAWTGQQAVQRLCDLGDVPISSIEQPLPRGQEQELVQIKQVTPVRIMHDESLVSMGDAERLLQMRVADAFNIRLAKNGGFLAAIRLAHFARKHGIAYQLGCMVGETSILSAAGRRFLENVPGVMFAEGSYGRFLLNGDVTDRPVRFGYGGKIRPLPGFGWGVDVRRDLLEQYAGENVMELRL